jgi:hypothetical protein
MSMLNILGKKILSQVEKVTSELNQLKNQEIIEVGLRNIKKGDLS